MYIIVVDYSIFLIINYSFVYTAPNAHAGMSIDHHIAVNRPLSYTRLMSPRRTGIMIAIFVLVGPLLGFSDMLLELGHTVLVVSGAVNDPRFTENMFCDRVDVSVYVHARVCACVCTCMRVCVCGCV